MRSEYAGVAAIPRQRSCARFTSVQAFNYWGAAAMTLREILHVKGNVVHTIGSDATLDCVVQTLVMHNCGSLVVCDHDPRDIERRTPARMVGIITERDILKACATGKSPLTAVKVAEVMTRDVAIGSPDHTVEDTMGLMTQRRIRHLPVIEEGQLIGLISIGDVVKMQHDRLSMENHYLKSYLHG
jgi:CBS domain-containing protein